MYEQYGNSIKQFLTFYLLKAIVIMGLSCLYISIIYFCFAYITSNWLSSYLLINLFFYPVRGTLKSLNNPVMVVHQTPKLILVICSSIQ